MLSGHGLGGEPFAEDVAPVPAGDGKALRVGDQRYVTDGRTRPDGRQTLPDAPGAAPPSLLRRARPWCPG
ncbi:hypothetical protein SVIO_014710 [Streptomyces violaceusniger]|uniref:Uncharacterized protein n=1 Tax=Streptomyces violaceusniger TaxID=68280 RepID=A0A4D4KWX7_STRVO|nr:hypothetical protein SVIO_014710 [Streptomyces violaceusniger]